MLDPIVGKDDLFRNGNSNYRRDIVHGPEFTKVVEVWPNQDGSLVERESLFVAREIKRVSISYPLTRGYSPRFNCLGYSVNFKLTEEESLLDVWQVYISRKSYIAESGFESDYIVYNQGFFDHLKLNTEAGKAWTRGSIEIFASGTSLMVNGKVVNQAGVALLDNQVIKGKVFDKQNMIVVSREDRSVRKMDEMYFPLRFDLSRLGALMLGCNVNLLRNEYPAGYTLADIKFGGEDLAQIAKNAVRLQTSQPGQQSQGQTCLDICRSNGWEPTEGDVVRLVKLWDKTRQGKWSERLLSLPRLEFARWLYEHGKISG